MDHSEPGRSLQLRHNLSAKAINPVSCRPTSQWASFSLQCSFSINGIHLPHRKDLFAPMWHTPSSFQELERSVSQTANLSQSNFPGQSPNPHHRLTGTLLGTSGPQPCSLLRVRANKLNSTVSPRGNGMSFGGSHCGSLAAVTVEYGGLGIHPFTSEYKLRMNVLTTETW